MRKISTVLALSCLVAAPAPLPAQDTAPAAAKKKEPRTIELVAPSGAYADLPETGFDLTSMMLGGGAQQAKAFYEMVEQIDALAEGDGSRLVLFDLSRSIGINLAQAAELERSLAKLRAAGVKCYAYIENAAGSQYAIASQCDQVIMADMGMVDLGSLALSSLYLKDALNMLGIQMDVLRCGDFKGAAEPFMLSRMSPHLRRHYEEMLSRMNDDVVRRIAKGRGLRADQVRKLQGKRLMRAEEALSAGLVDHLVPWQGAKKALSAVLGDDAFELKDALKKKKKRGFNLMALMQELFKPKEDEEVEEETLVVYHLSGPIVDGSKPAPGNIVSGPTVAALRRMADNDQVKGVVVRINSPGGSATASEAIVLALADLAKKKPVVCSMGYVAGSGGYYVTCFGRPILAEAGTITGSIGVLGVKPNIGPLMRRYGLHQELIALDESAAMDALDKGWSDDDKELLQGYMNDVYDRFVKHVAASRNMSREQVLAIAGGRVWSGDQAVENKLIDRIGGLEQALAMVAEEAGVKAGYEVTHQPRPRTFMDTFAEQMMEMRAALPERIPVALLRRLGSLRTPLAVLWDALHSEQPTRVWAVMPAELTIR